MARGGRARVEPRALLPRALGGHPGEHASHPPSGGHERQLQRLQLPRLRGPRGSSLHPAPGDISPASPEPFPASASTGRAIPSPLAAPAAPLPRRASVAWRGVPTLADVDLFVSYAGVGPIFEDVDRYYYSLDPIAINATGFTDPATDPPYSSSAHSAIESYLRMRRSCTCG